MTSSFFPFPDRCMQMHVAQCSTSECSAVCWIGGWQVFKCQSHLGIATFYTGANPQRQGARMRLGRGYRTICNLDSSTQAIAYQTVLEVWPCNVSLWIHKRGGLLCRTAAVHVLQLDVVISTSYSWKLSNGGSDQNALICENFTTRLEKKQDVHVNVLGHTEVLQIVRLCKSPPSRESYKTFWLHAKVVQGYV